MGKPTHNADWLQWPRPKANTKMFHPKWKLPFKMEKDLHQTIMENLGIFSDLKVNFNGVASKKGRSLQRETMARINNQIHSSWDGIGKGNKNGLIKRWRSAAARITNNIVITDKIPTKVVQERNFIVHNPDNGRIKEKELTGIVSYTDGSLLNNQTGCGVHTVLGKTVI